MISASEFKPVCSVALILTLTLLLSSSSSSSSPFSACSGIVTEPFRQFGDEETMEPDLDPWSRPALPGNKGACKDVIELLLCVRESTTHRLLAAASLCSSSSKTRSHIKLSLSTSQRFSLTFSKTISPMLGLVGTQESR